MRLRSVTAPDPAQALARIRASLGQDAVIVATQQLKDGGVRVTAAIDDQDVDLAALLAPPGRPQLAWLASLAAHHGLPEALRQRLEETLDGAGDVEPVAALAQALRALFRFRPLPSSGRATLLLTGPPGAGKTASVAKLAARAVLAGGAVDVITTDVARTGGVAQLAGLLAPLHLEPVAAGTPGEVRGAVADRRAELVLIDSAGLNPFRPADLGRVTALIQASGAEPVLVLPAGLAVAECTDVAANFRALGVHRMLVTRLDAARRLGGLLAAAETGLAFSDGGIGPVIGRGLCPLSAAGLARLLIHAHGSAAASPAEPSAPATRARPE